MYGEMEVEEVQVSSGDGANAELQVPADQGTDQVAWAQCMLEASYFESCFSPRIYFSPKGDSPKPVLPEFCPSPLLSDQIKMVQSWSSRVTKQAEESVCMSSESQPCMSSEPDKSLSNLRTECGEFGDGKLVVKNISRKRKAESSDDDDDGSLNEEKHSSEKKMKVKGPKRLREPRYAIKTRSEVDIMEDGYKWRKYGQKPVKSSPHPRNYYRCTTANCPVRKRVERDTEDTSLVITSYEGTHSHPKVIQQKNSGAGQWNNFQLLSDVGLNMDPLFPPIPNLTHLWGSPLNFPAWPQQQAPSVHDNLSLIMAYQLVKLQWELQARTQQFMDFNNQTATNTTFPTPEMVNNFPEPGPPFPNPQTLSMGSSLLRKRASAFRNGGPIPLDLQSIAKMQHLRAAQHQQVLAPEHEQSCHSSEDFGLLQAPK